MSWKDDLNYGLAAFGLRIPDGLALDQKLPQLAQQPAHSLAKVVVASGVLFYVLERHHNPKVKDIWDAMLYTSTCLSVGYADIHPRTPLGKVLGSILMTYGPALADKAFDGERLERQDATQQQILSTLQAILAKLEGNAA